MFAPARFRAVRSLAAATIAASLLGPVPATAGAVPPSLSSLPALSSDLLGQQDQTSEQDHRAEYLGRFDFGAQNTDPSIGGLSGIDQSGDGYIAISDDKNEHGPIRAYRFQADDEREFQATETVPLTQSDGEDYTGYIDAEEIRELPNGNLLWTTEGKAKDGDAVPPQLIESTADGHEVRRIDVPSYHQPDGHEHTGVYDNNGPEAMTLLPGGQYALTVNENALAQDGSKNSDTEPSLNRVTIYDLETGQPAAEYVLPVEAQRGVTSALTDEDGNLYILQRGYLKDIGENRAEIYKVDLSAADDVLGKESLDGTEATAQKDLVFDFATVEPHPDNVEGMAWGPHNEDGSRTLFVVSDDNFNDSQSTLFHTLKLN